MDELKKFGCKLFLDNEHNLLPLECRDPIICTICKHEISMDLLKAVLILDCRHLFHFECIMEYDNCPCKYEGFHEIPKNQYDKLSPPPYLKRILNVKSTLEEQVQMYEQAKVYDQQEQVDERVSEKEQVQTYDQTNVYNQQEQINERVNEEHAQMYEQAAHEVQVNEQQINDRAQENESVNNKLKVPIKSSKKSYNASQTYQKKNREGDI
ncbi:hypothetical protein F8M41_024947 [Gigaspora margarita]|uniref:RING-type domain-containing protein n=1 Tax=Gigaspora margarita TaxID=4874 RepID=A0A8H4B087_GIGMA|nr:hypothetical protein F8M41_024947 [Gigaspora margarita]